MLKVSIIIPCYNQAEFLADTLSNLQKQTLSDFECIVVDDGSTDDSADIVRVFACLDSRFCLVQKENGGTASARNLGLKRAKGEYIQFLDADDGIDVDKLRRQVELMEKTNVDVSYTDFLHFREDVPGEIVYVPHSKIKSRALCGLRFSLLTRWGIDFSLPPGAFLYRRTFIESHNLHFFEEIRFREDWNFHLEVSKCKPKICSLPDYVGAFYRINPKGKTSSAQKITSGNIMFLEYKCHQLHGTELILWAYRMSCELLMLLGRCVKYHSFSGLSLLGKLFSSSRSTVLFVLAVFLLPLAFVHTLIRSVIEYTL